MSLPTQMVLLLCLPLVAMGLTTFFGRRANLREAAQLITGTTLFAVAQSLAQAVFRGQRPEWELWEFIPGFALKFQMEPLGMVFALVASGLWVVTTVYAMGYLRAHEESHQTRFFVCFGAAIFAAMGASMSANLLTLFVFYEIMTLSTYPLVTHHGTEAARQGGRTYLGILISTSVGLLLMAIAWTWSVAGRLDFQVGGILRDAFAGGELSKAELAVLFGLFVYGTGKAALMPIHRWLPAAMVAPTPVSALLHAVAVVKVGVFTVLKVAVYTFGLPLLRETGASEWVAYLAGASIVIGSLIAMRQDNLKRRLAYSTISQLAYITLGASLATPSAWVGGALHIVTHAVGKITLFFCAGAIYVATHKTNVSQLRGLGWRMPYTFAAFAIASLSIIGLPPCGGLWSKWFLGIGAAEAEHPWLLAALMLSSLLNISYLLPVAVMGFLPECGATGRAHDHGQPKIGSGSEPREDARATGAEIHEAPLLCVVPLCLTAVGTLVLFWGIGALHEALLPLTQSSR